MKNYASWLIGQKITPITFDSDLDMIMLETPAHTDGPPPHYHANFDEFFLIVEGELEFLMNDKIQIKRKGDYVVIPKNLVHTFSNKSDQPAKVFNIHAPRGFGEYMQSLSVADSVANACELSKSPEYIQKLIETATANDFNIVMGDNQPAVSNQQEVTQLN